MLALLDPTRLIVSSTGEYSLHMAASLREIQSAQRLRFAVFNLELNEGLAASREGGLDQDEYDAVCEHLLVNHNATGNRSFRNRDPLLAGRRF